MLLDGLECFLAVLDASGRYGVVFPVLDDNQWDWMVLIIIGWYWTILDGMLVQWMVLDGIVCYWMELDGIVWYWMELDGIRRYWITLDYISFKVMHDILYSGCYFIVCM